ncbi:hypothetical protein F2Q70_00025903 [Brassica cretica]|uniref:Uncharacterized protein n=1 Tax=Brassica cretica TaxID=69181 RepID=A0A8S9L6N7_BRACR|nr:hypothetical protein F2Q70_00025903 [Brassica cretica]
MPDRNTGGSTRLPPPPPPSGSGAGTNIPSGGRTSASVFQARVSTPSTDEYQRTDADPAALRTNLARSLRTNERPISPASWEDDRARSHQEPARRVHAQHYQEQQGNSTAILPRSRKFGTFDPQGSTLLIDRQHHLCDARFCSTTIDPDTSSVDR